MIERESAVRIYSEILSTTLGAKMAKGRLVRVSNDGLFLGGRRRDLILLGVNVPWSRH